MGIAKLYSQSGGNEFKINGIIQDYYVYAGENVSAGNFVEFINGIANKKVEISVDTSVVQQSYYGNTISATELSDNRVFIAHNTYYMQNANSHLHGVVCTFDGGKITAGTDIVLDSADYTGYFISAVTLSGGNIFITYSATSSIYLYGMVCSVSGTTISIVTNKTTTTGGNVISAVSIGNNRAFVFHQSGNTRVGTICTFSGSSITLGTQVTLYSHNYGDDCKEAILLSSGKIFIVYDYSSADSLNGMVCTISGTTITAGTNTTLSTTQATSYVVASPVELSNGNIFIPYKGNTSNQLRGMVCTISGTTITKGTDVVLTTSQNSGSTISAVLISDNKVLIFHNYSTSQYLYGMVCIISGTTITTGTDTPLITETSHTGKAISSLVLPSGNFFVAHSRASSYYLNAQVFGVDETNNIPTTQITTIKYETQVRKATTSDIYGVSKTKGTGGDSTGHKDKVNVYQPYEAFNLVSNGNFNKKLDTTNWSAQRADVSIEQGSLKTVFNSNTSSSNFVLIYYYIGNKVTAINGHKYYYSFKIQIPNTTVGTFFTTLLGQTSIFFDNIPKDNSWHGLSGVMEATKAGSDDSYRRLALNIKAPTKDDIIWFDDIKFYDLTEMFGAGKEPTKEWCDEKL